MRASEHNPVEVLVLSYDQLDELLAQSEATREALRKLANRNMENVARRSPGDLPGREGKS